MQKSRGSEDTYLKLYLFQKIQNKIFLLVAFQEQAYNE